MAISKSCTKRRRIDDDVIRKVVDRMGPTADLNARHTPADT